MSWKDFSVQNSNFLFHAFTGPEKLANGVVDGFYGQRGLFPQVVVLEVIVGDGFESAVEVAHDPVGQLGDARAYVEENVARK